MLKYVVMNFIFCIIFLLNIELIFCYKKYTIENDELCSPIKKRKISLDTKHNHNNGLIVSQTRLNDHSISWRNNLNCKFQVDVNSFLSKLQRTETDGLVVVIQQLSFRQDKETGECIDYVQFKTEHAISERYCGPVSMDDNINIKFPISMYDPHGKIDTTIFVDQKKLESEDRMDLLLVYTPTKKSCVKEDDSYLTCSEVPPICIRSEFRNDTFLNCPNCIDEGVCRIQVKHSTGIGTLATVAAASFLFVGFIIFLSLIWILKKFKLVCWHPSFESGRVLSNTQPGTEMRQTSNVAADVTTSPTAPPATTMIDKDLPPPYESLFPDR